MGISIFDTENLPAENTLLLHFTLSGFGVWDYAQQYCGYRNVCDSEWTLMYPNFQHPRHTDAPFLIAENQVMQGTFAWNYGGIPGIQSENFDNAHSYLVQLAVYNTLCGQSGGGGGNTGTGETGSDPISGASGVQAGGTKPPRVPPPTWIPGIPVPPVPGPGGPGNIGTHAPAAPAPINPRGTGEVGAGGGGEVTDPVGIFIQSDPDPQWTPTGIMGTPTDTSTTSVSAQGAPAYAPLVPHPDQISLRYSPTEIMGIFGPSSEPSGSSNGLVQKDPASPLGLYSQGGQGYSESYEGSSTIGLVPRQRKANPVDLTPTFVPREGQYLNRSTNESLGGDPRSSLFAGGFSQRIPVTMSSKVGLDGTAQDKILPLSQALDLWKLSPEQTTENLIQIDGSSINQAVTLRCEVGSREVYAGERMVVAAFMQTLPSVTIRAKLQTFVQDSQGRAFLLGETDFATVTNETPLRIGGSYRTDFLAPGPILILVLAKDQDYTIIRSSSLLASIRSVSAKSFAGTQDDLLRTARNPESTVGVPTPLVNLLRLHEEHPFQLPQGEAYQVLLERTGAGHQYSLLVQAPISQLNLNVRDTSRMGVLNQLVTGGSLYETSDRVILDNTEFLPSTHVVAAPLQSASGNPDLLTVQIARGLNTPDENMAAQLHVGGDYAVRETSISFSRTSTLSGTVTATTPYPWTELKLFVRGYMETRIPPAALAYTSITDLSGIASFTGVAILPNQFLSLVHPGNGAFNQQTNTFFLGEVTA